jgi:hypothetical protein
MVYSMVYSTVSSLYLEFKHDEMTKSVVVRALSVIQETQLFIL